MLLLEKNKMHVGFIIDGLYPSFSRLIHRKCRLQDLFFGKPSPSSIGLMRFKWIASRISSINKDIRYELYRSWRRYDVVVLMKSMGADIEILARKLRQAGTVLVYDANVDYLTPAFGTFYYKGMKPTEDQRECCRRIVRLVDGVIADSQHLADIFESSCDSTHWISDNVNMDLVPDSFEPSGFVDGKLYLFWSGMSCKLFDLLLIENVLRTYSKYIHLHIITDKLVGMERIFEPWLQKLKNLLSDLDVTMEEFVSIPLLLQRYSQGGLAISPRFLDNSYNLGHTEWKITLPMACGKTVLCSNQMSYMTVARRNKGRGVRICESVSDWNHKIDTLLTGNFDWEHEGTICQNTVKEYYSSTVVAKQHSGYLNQLLGANN